jgi:hypothetical protein
MDNFNNLGNDIGAVQSIMVVLLLNGISWMANYFNPIIGTISILGSAIYIWLKIKKEFWDPYRDKPE